MAVVMASSGYYSMGMGIPGLRDALDKHSIDKLARLLHSYGHADYIIDASQYRVRWPINTFYPERAYPWKLYVTVNPNCRPG
jgi:hypothetical protein